MLHLALMSWLKTFWWLCLCSLVLDVGNILLLNCAAPLSALGRAVAWPLQLLQQIARRHSLWCTSHMLPRHWFAVLLPCRAHTLIGVLGDMCWPCSLDVLLGTLPPCLTHETRPPSSIACFGWLLLWCTASLSSSRMLCLSLAMRSNRASRDSKWLSGCNAHPSAMSCFFNTVTACPAASARLCMLLLAGGGIASNKRHRVFPHGRVLKPYCQRNTARLALEGTLPV